MRDLGRLIEAIARKATEHAGRGEGTNIAGAVNIGGSGHVTAAYTDDEVTILHTDGETRVVHHRRDQDNATGDTEQ